MNYKLQIKKSLFIIVLLTVIFSVPVFALAQNSTSNTTDLSGETSNTTDLTPSAETKIVNPISATTVNGFIKQVLEGVIKIGIPIVALAIIYCGFLFVQARGKPEAIKKAKDALIYTLIGAAILLGAWAIAQLISDTVLAL